MSGLTPIRVRGRRKRVHHDDQQQQQQQQRALNPARPRRKGGRPLMSLDAKQSGQSTQSNKRRQLHPAVLGYDGGFDYGTFDVYPGRKKKKLSKLELLPVELLEKIFLYALNVDFARASPVLGLAVSSERVWRVLVLLAFWRDPAPSLALSPSSASELTVSMSELASVQENRNSDAVARILRPFNSAPLTDDERRDLQSAVLSCRWCTFELVRRQLPELMNLAVQRYWVGAGMVMEGGERERLNRFLAGDEADDDNGGQDGVDIRTFHGTDGNNKPHTLTINPLISMTISVNSEEPQQQQPLLPPKTYYILDLTHIPNTLLNPPNQQHTTQSTAFLELLRLTSGFHVADPRSMLDNKEKNIAFSRDALQRGIHTAIVQQNYIALSCLLKIDEYAVRCENTITTTPPTPANPDPNPQPNNTAQIQSIGPYILPAHHFHTAIRTSPTDPTSMHLLFRASAESLPPDDPEITTWAMEDAPGALGAWVLDFMLSVPGHGHGHSSDWGAGDYADGEGANTENGMFWMGAANAGSEMGRRYLDLLGVEGLDGWMGDVGLDFRLMRDG